MTEQKCDLEVEVYQVEQQTSVGRLVCKRCGRTGRWVQHKDDIRNGLENAPVCRVQEKDNANKDQVGIQR